MDNLPLELKHEICSYLTPKDLKSVRLQNNDFSTAGACYILPRVFVFNCTKSVDELKEIARHPILSKQVKTLVCDPSYLGDIDSFHVWNDLRAESCHVPRWKDYEAHQSKDSNGNPDERSVRAMRRAENEYAKACSQCPVSPPLIEEVWARYQARVKMQSSGEFQRSLAAAITLALSSCPNSDGLMIVSDTRTFMTIRSRLYADVYANYKLWDQTNRSNFEMVLKTVKALSARFISIRHLAITEAPLSSLDTLVKSDWFGAIALKLKSLRLAIAYEPLKRDGPVVWDSLRAQLSHLHHIEVLKLSGPDPWDCPRNFEILLQHAHWNSVHTIALKCFVFSESVLVDMLLRHSATLQRLAFIDCYLTSGTWVSAFTRLAGRFTRLKRVRLDLQLDPEAPGYPSIGSNGNFTNSLTVKVQDFIMHGGVMPTIPQDPYNPPIFDTIQPDFEDQSDEIDACFW